MSAVASPYGLVPVQLIGGQAFSGGTVREFAMTANSANGIFTGDPVNVASGAVIVVTGTSPTTTANAYTPVGVCVGVRYVDPVLKQQQFAPYLPANAITNGYTKVYIRVVDDPDALFKIQSTGATTAASIGLNAPLTVSSTGSTTTGNSVVSLTHASIAGTSTLAVRIVDIISADAYAEVLVKWNQGVHAYYNSTGQ